MLCSNWEVSIDDHVSVFNSNPGYNTTLLEKVEVGCTLAQRKRPHNVHSFPRWSFFLFLSFSLSLSILLYISLSTPLRVSFLLVSNPPPLRSLLFLKPCFIFSVTYRSRSRRARGKRKLRSLFFLPGRRKLWMSFLLVLRTQSSRARSRVKQEKKRNITETGSQAKPESVLLKEGYPKENCLLELRSNLYSKRASSLISELASGRGLWCSRAVFTSLTADGVPFIRLLMEWVSRRCCLVSCLFFACFMAPRVSELLPEELD